ncbi:MAG: DUF1080 domain-containing protein [Candidatus Omnitrophica bacterium]|nr:hypothetical protein [bacterium]NUN98773.1 DUF1080 domain-containing protein [Candidatus Omnitrophota bacterium]
MKQRHLKLVLVGLVGLSLSATAGTKEPSIVPAEANNDGWIALFNGKDLTGWEPVGTAADWKVSDGAIEVVGTGDGWLASVATFGDFELIVEWWVSKGGNSGIFFRAGTDGKPWVNGYESQIDDDDTKNPTGSIYNRIKAKKVSTPDEQWNTTEIRAEGSQITVKLNGEQVADGSDETFKHGRIGLQMHDDKTTVKFRKVWIRPLGLKPLYNGKDFANWKVKTKTGEPVEIKVVDGVIRIQGGPGYVESNGDYGDFHARFKIKTEPREDNSSNSGVFMRGPRHPGDDFRKWPEGLEAQVFNEPEDFTTGGFYHFVKAPAVYAQNNEWFWMDINAVGNRYQTWVNGMPVSTWVDPKDRFKSGVFGLQAHDPLSIIYYGAAEVAELAPHVDGK